MRRRASNPYLVDGNDNMEAIAVGGLDVGVEIPTHRAAVNAIDLTIRYVLQVILLGIVTSVGRQT